MTDKDQIWYSSQKNKFSLKEDFIKNKYINSDEEGDSLFQGKIREEDLAKDEALHKIDSTITDIQSTVAEEQEPPKAEVSAEQVVADQELTDEKSFKTSIYEAILAFLLELKGALAFEDQGPSTEQLLFKIGRKKRSSILAAIMDFLKKLSQRERTMAELLDEQIEELIQQMAAEKNPEAFKALLKQLQLLQEVKSMLSRDGTLLGMAATTMLMANMLMREHAPSVEQAREAVTESRQIMKEQELSKRLTNEERARLNEKLQSPEMKAAFRSLGIKVGKEKTAHAILRPLDEHTHKQNTNLASGLFWHLANTLGSALLNSGVAAALSNAIGNHKENKSAEKPKEANQGVQQPKPELERTLERQVDSKNEGKAIWKEQDSSIKQQKLAYTTATPSTILHEVTIEKGITSTRGAFFEGQGRV